MPSRLIFDTNFLRKMGAKEYLKGEIPQKLEELITLALKRGDAFCIPRTVEMEMNSWINNFAQKELEKVDQAKELLLKNGFSVEPVEKIVTQAIDVIRIIKAKFPDVYILEPTIENYIEAEKRTSFREPPLPKNADGEEFRDRLIWCQVLTLGSETPSIIVSEDKIFDNGANSEEGVACNISIIKNEEELNQLLDNRPSHIQQVIDDLLLFTDELQNNGIKLDLEKIDRVVDYRSINESDGTIIKRFLIIFENDESSPVTLPCKIYYQGESPVSVSVQLNDSIINCTRDLSDEDLKKIAIEQNLKVSEQHFQEEELRRLIGD